MILPGPGQTMAFDRIYTLSLYNIHINLIYVSKYLGGVVKLESP